LARREEVKMAIRNFFQSSGGTTSQGNNLQSQEVTFVDQSSITINHTFESKPTVTIVDTQGNVIVADVQYTSNQQVVVIFSVNLSGTVILR